MRLILKNYGLIETLFISAQTNYLYFYLKDFSMSVTNAIINSSDIHPFHIKPYHRKLFCAHFDNTIYCAHINNMYFCAFLFKAHWIMLWWYVVYQNKNKYRTSSFSYSDVKMMSSQVTSFQNRQWFLFKKETESNAIIHVLALSKYIDKWKINYVNWMKKKIHWKNLKKMILWTLICHFKSA